MPASAWARAAALAALVPIAVALGACGTPSPDLFIVERSGTVPGAKLHLLVSDTSARCNHGKPIPLTSKQTIEARDILDKLRELQAGDNSALDTPPAQIFSYLIRDEDGILRFSDTTQRPTVLPRTALFARRVAIDTCKLAR